MTEKKVEDLKQHLAAMSSLLVAFSGGVDSTFLLKMAYDELGTKVLAVTAASATYPRKELEYATAFCSTLGIKHKIITVDQLQIPDFVNNPYERCYFCKRHLFQCLREIAVNMEIDAIADGSNQNDLNDFRPGMKALKELGILTPLLEVGLTKEEIRTLSQQMNLPTWNKPASACLASRFPYGEAITASRLAMVEKAEEYLAFLGFKQIRVRMHNNLARIEVGYDERPLLASSEMMDEVSIAFKKLGFTFVTMDLTGYQSGCFNPGR